MAQQIQSPELHRHGLRGSLPCHPYAGAAFHDLSMWCSRDIESAVLSRSLEPFALNGSSPRVVALALNSGAYLSEIIRSGIQSIDGGQTEAARSLGLSQVQNMRFVMSAAGHQEYPARHRQRVRHHHQGVRYLLHHRRAGHHVRGQLHQGCYLPHCGTAGGGHLCCISA